MVEKNLNKDLKTIERHTQHILENKRLTKEQGETLKDFDNY